MEILYELLVLFLGDGGGKVEMKKKLLRWSYIPVGTCAFQCTCKWYRKRGS